MLNEEHGAYNRHKTRTAVLCFLFLRDNAPISVFMLIFEYNGQTTVILFAHRVAVSVHCNKQQSQVLFCTGWGRFVSKEEQTHFAPGEAALLTFHVVI